MAFPRATTNWSSCRWAASGEIGMNFNAYGFGPPDDRAMDHRRLRRAVRPRSRHARRRRHHAGHPLSWRSSARTCWASCSPMRMRIISAPSRHLWPQLRCPIYATPFTARLIEGKLEEAGLQRPGAREARAAGRQAQARPVRDRFHFHHPFDPGAQRARDPHAAGRCRPYRRLEDRSRSAAGRGDRHRRAHASSATRACWRLVCDSTNALVQGIPARKREVRDSLTELIGTLKGRVAVTAFASNVARLDTIAQAARDAWPPGRAGRPLDAQDRRRGARHRLSQGFPARARRGRGRASCRRNGALSLHRQPGRAARRAGPHRRRTIIPMSIWARAMR